MHLNPSFLHLNQLTNPHGCEIQQAAGGVSHDAGDAQEGEVNQPHLVLVVLQDAETAGGPGGKRALKGPKRLSWADRKRNASDLWRWILQVQPRLNNQSCHQWEDGRICAFTFY